LEAFDQGAQIDLLRPGGAVLAMEIKIGLGDHIGCKPVVWPAAAIVATSWPV